VSRLAIALVHHPVVDKNGHTITAAVTSLDLHDIARSARTYGVGSYYVVTPLSDQQALVRRIVGHWETGVGAQYNPDRGAALALIRLLPTLEAVRRELSEKDGIAPRVVVTSARMADSNLSYGQLRGLVHRGEPVLLVFGTAWGLAPELIAQADYRLAPIEGAGDYNHLAVRSAAAIILDRIRQKPIEKAD
jgi:hypothetical protein